VWLIASYLLYLSNSTFSVLIAGDELLRERFQIWNSTLQLLPQIVKFLVVFAHFPIPLPQIKYILSRYGKYKGIIYSVSYIFYGL